MGARAVYNPLPTIPDDLRSQAIREVAVARLHIHIDGTVTVELVRPTHQPRINKIILDTLRTWMFYPAISKGVPVESVQEIRIDVSVGD
jgi:protein TonB